MPGFAEELRLIGFLIVNAVVLLGAWRLARRTAASDHALRWLDTLSLWILVQYVSVGIAGMVHGLNVPLVYSLAVLFGGLMACAGGRNTSREALPPSTESPTLLWEALCTWGLVALPIGFVAAYVYEQRFVPVLAADALTYHLPAAVRWMQDGTLSLYDVWHWNPANTYSPLAGSTFIAWLLLPFGHDVLARFVQIPAVALMGVATATLCRALSLRGVLAVAVAATVILSRPTISQATLAKDDLFVTGLFIAIIAACSADRLRLPAGPVRLGVLVGLLLAMKYTVLLVAPVLLLLIDAPVRAGWRWRQWLTAAAIAALLAGPWYVRNWLLTGNPLFPIDVRPLGVPIFDGMFASRRDDSLASPVSIWHVITGTYFSLPAVLLVPAALLAAGLLSVQTRRSFADPMTRTLLIGPFVGFAIFIVAAPFAESRFLFPLYAMLLVAGGLAIARLLPSMALSLPGILVLLMLAVATVFERSHYAAIISFFTAGVVAAAVAMIAIALRRLMPSIRWYPTVPVGGGVVAFLAIYVFWNAYVVDYHNERSPAWSSMFGASAEAWALVNEQVPVDATLAIANTTSVYPLFGNSLARRLVYAPVRTGISHVHDLPLMNGQRLNGAEIARLIPPHTVENADRDAWLANLRSAGAQYLYVAKREALAEPWEPRFAAAMPNVFVPIVENDHAILYRIVSPGLGE